MLRGWSSATDRRLLLQVQEVIKKEDYVDILKDNVNKSLASLTLGCKPQQNKGLKHIFKPFQSLLKVTWIDPLDVYPI